MQVNGIATVTGHRDFLAGRIDETPLLLADLLPGVTNFPATRRLSAVSKVRFWAP
jgi:hypothetical protein